MMKGIQLKEIHQALLAAYNPKSLKMMLKFRMDRDLDDLVGEDSMTNMVFELLTLAEEEGWENDLVREAQRYNPGNAELGKIYEKYGFAPKINVIDQGSPLSAVDAKPSSGGLEKIIRSGNPSLDMAVWRTRLSEVEVRICRVDINHAPAGTGILVGPQTVLTNYHVVKDVIEGLRPLSSVTCLFDFKVLVDGTTSAGPRATLSEILSSATPTDGELNGQPEITLPTALELDYALLHLTKAMGSEPTAGAESPSRGWEVLPSTAVNLTPGQGLIIAQHPAGEAMKLSIDTAGVISTNANGSRIRYRNNTEGGSSGSPVFDMLWNYVALHHMGDPAQNHPPQYNQGVVPLSAIRQRITDQGHGDLLG
jgi:Effector-associated domain 1/Trypsin-like peptidase domain